MNPAVIIALIDGLIAMIEKLAPMVQQMASKGEVTTEQQQKLMDRMSELDNLALFSGPEWRIDPTTPPTTNP